MPFICKVWTQPPKVGDTRWKNVKGGGGAPNIILAPGRLQPSFVPVAYDVTNLWYFIIPE